MKASDTFMDYQRRVGHARCKYNDGAEVRVARFRRQGKLIHDQRADWHQWLAQHALDISVAELPVSVLETEMSWWYLIDRGYSQEGYLGTENWFDLVIPPCPICPVQYLGCGKICHGFRPPRTPHKRALRASIALHLLLRFLRQIEDW